MSTKYLSARRLGITTAEHRALIQVAEIIGASPYIGDRTIRDFEDNKEPKRGLGFNMSFIAQAWDCGTSCCIGGHVSLLMQGVDMTDEHPLVTAEQREIAEKYVFRSDTDSRDGGNALTPLYYPAFDVMDDARPVDAIHAIRNFLTTGKPRWRAVINERRQREEQERANA